jgi:hypothetical protein
VNDLDLADADANPDPLVPDFLAFAARPADSRAEKLKEVAAS